MSSRFRHEALRFVLPILLSGGLAVPALSAADGESAVPNPKARIIQLKTLVQDSPNDKSLRRQLGLAYLESGLPADAEKELRKAIELGLSPDAVSFPLAEAMLMQGKNQEVLDTLKPVALMSPADQALLQAYRGDAWAALGNPANAKKDYALALNFDGACARAKLGLARIASAEKNAPLAQRLVEEVLAEQPNNAEAWSFQGSLLAASGNLAKAEASLLKAIAAKNFSPVERGRLAMIRILMNRPAEAEADIAILRKEGGNLFLAEYFEGVLRLRQGRFAEAQTAFEKAAKMNQKLSSLNYFLGEAHFRQKHYNEAEDHLSRYLAADPSSLEARTLLGMIALEKKSYEKARAYGLAVLDKQPNDQGALALLAAINLAEGNTLKAMDYNRKLAAVAKASQGAAREASRKAALADLDAAGGIDEAREKQLTTAIIQCLAAQEFKPAEELIRKIEAKAPQSPFPYRMAALLYLTQKSPEKARTALETALSKKPGDPAVIFALAQLALQQKNPTLARKYFEDGLRVNPKDASLRLHLAELDNLEGHPDAAAERLAALVKDDPGALQPRLQWAALLLAKGDAEQARRMLEEARKDHGQEPTFLALLAETQLAAGKPGEAAETAQALARIQPKSGLARFLLSRAYSEAGDSVRGREALQQAIAVEPKFPPARTALIRVLAAEKKLGEARAQLNDLARDFPDSREVLELQGWLAGAEGDPKKALAANRTLFQKFPDETSAILLAEAQWKAGDAKQALATLEGWTRQHPGAPDARMKAAQIHLGLQQTGPAIQEVEEVLKIQPKNALALNNLAWLYRASNPAEALELAKAAAAIAPNSADVLDTLGMIELDRGEAEPALNALRRAAELAPDNPATRFHLALALDRANQRDQAIQILTELLANPRTFPEQGEAKAKLEALSGR